MHMPHMPHFPTAEGVQHKLHEGAAAFGVKAHDAANAAENTAHHLAHNVSESIFSFKYWTDLTSRFMPSFFSSKSFGAIRERIPDAIKDRIPESMIPEALRAEPEPKSFFSDWSYGDFFLYGLGGLVLTLVGIFVVSWLVHRFVLRTGAVKMQRYRRSGVSHWVVAGDIGADWVHRAVFVADAYFQNGVSLDATTRAPFILDIGANTGLFALACALKCGRDRGGRGCEVHSFEPVPQVAAVARKNAQLAMEKDNRNRLTVHPLALGATSGEVDFMYSPGFSSSSTMFGKEMLNIARRHGMCSWARAAIHDSAASGQFPGLVASPLVMLLSVPVLNWFVLLMMTPFIVGMMLFFAASPLQPTMIKVPVGTLSQVLDDLSVRRNEGAITTIDMLKIDVEGAEWQVLQGLRDDHWKLVQQCAIQVHNVGGRVERVKELLREKGFTNIGIGEEALWSHELLDISSIFATRGRK